MQYFTDYEVVSETEALGLIPEGNYQDCYIRDIDVKKGKEDKKYIVLTVDVYTNGKPITIIQWLYSNYLLRNLCVILSLLDKYESKTIDPLKDIKGREVGCVVKLTPATDKYKPKNSISDFFISEKLPNNAFSDEIKF